MADVSVRVSTSGAGRVARAFAVGGRLLHGIVLDEMTREVGPAMADIYRGFSPHDTGRLARGIRSQAGTSGARAMVEIRSTATSDEGYSYTGVTRFGHRAGRIYPRDAKALRFTIGGRVIFAKWVKGYRPGSDWVLDARPAVEAEAEAAAQRIGDAIERRLS